MEGLGAVVAAETAPQPADFFERLPSTFPGTDWAIYFLLMRQSKGVVVRNDVFRIRLGLRFMMSNMA